MKGLTVFTLVLAMGCGEVVKNNNDADGDTDADTDGDADNPDGDTIAPDAPPVPVSTRFRALSFRADGVPYLNSTFVVQAADGSVLGMGPVDIEGYFTIDLIDEVTVTLVRVDEETSESIRFTNETLLGVKPGDDIVFGLPARDEPPYVTQMFTVVTKVPLYTEHSLTTPCFSGFTNADGFLELPFTEACRSPTFPLFGFASGGPDPDRFFYRPMQPFVEQGAIEPPPSFDSTVRPFLLTLTSLPPDVGRINANRTTLIGRMRAYSSGAGAAAAVGDIDLTMTYPPIPGQRYETNISITPNAGVMSYFDDARHTTTGAGQLVTFGEPLLPVISSITATPAGLEWTESANTGTGDATGAVMIFNWTDEATAIDYTIQWRVIGPSLTSPLVLPTLPAVTGVPDPTMLPTPPSVFGGVIGIEVDRITSYDKLRPVFDVFLSSTSDVEGLYPGEAFAMRRTQAIDQASQARLGTPDGLLLPWSTNVGGSAHAGQ